MSRSRSWEYDKLPVKPSDNGGSGRAVVQGALVTGEAVEVHETTLPPGQMPHPAHKHRHSELMMIREGTLEFDNGWQDKQRVGAGGVLLFGSNVMHGIKNVGTGPANYFVIAIGRESGRYSGLVVGLTADWQLQLQMRGFFAAPRMTAFLGAILRMGDEAMRMRGDGGVFVGWSERIDWVWAGDSCAGGNCGCSGCYACFE